MASAAIASFSCYPKPPALAGGVFTHIFYMIGVFISNRSFIIRLLALIFILGSFAGIEGEIHFFNSGQFLFLILPLACLVVPSALRTFSSIALPVNPLVLYEEVKDLLLLYRLKKRFEGQGQRQEASSDERREQEQREDEQRSTNSEKAQEKDAYAVLGVTRDMSYSEIRSIYLDLCQIYHPDKGKIKDYTRFMEIDEAWKEIKREKGEK